MTEDVLSDVLRAVRLTGAVYFDYELSSPWVAEAPPSQSIAAAVMPGAQRVIEYHLLARGDCWAHAVGEPPIRLSEGDLILFPQGGAHVLASAPGLRASPDLAAYARSSAPLPAVYEVGGGGPDEARVICGFLGVDERPYNPLLDALPGTLHVPASAGDGWVGTMFLTAVKESRHRRPGSENVLARLSELMFVEAIRRYLDALPAAHTGWLAGLRDPLVGQALSALHGRPADAWDGGVAGADGRRVALGAGRALRAAGWPAAHAVPGALAHATRRARPGRRRGRGGGRRRRRLRVGRGLQPGVQEGRGGIAGGLASQHGARFRVNRPGRATPGSISSARPLTVVT